VSLLGSLTHAAANFFGVIHLLAEITGVKSCFMPAPFFAGSVADKRVLLVQKGMGDVSRSPAPPSST
jgi:DNA-binding transcriptional regulator LsrR (DeoR family)